jgi:hypothetical protein
VIRIKKLTKIGQISFSSEIIHQQTRLMIYFLHILDNKKNYYFLEEDKVVILYLQN